MCASGFLKPANKMTEKVLRQQNLYLIEIEKLHLPQIEQLYSLSIINGSSFEHAALRSGNTIHRVNHLSKEKCMYLRSMYLVEKRLFVKRLLSQFIFMIPSVFQHF